MGIFPVNQQVLLQVLDLSGMSSGTGTRKNRGFSDSATV